MGQRQLEYRLKSTLTLRDKSTINFLLAPTWNSHNFVDLSMSLNVRFFYRVHSSKLIYLIICRCRLCNYRVHSPKLRYMYGGFRDSRVREIHVKLLENALQ